MGRHFVSAVTEAEMHRNAERLARQQWQGEVAGPRIFQKSGEYSAAELRRNWRPTIWDTVPSLMADKRHNRVSK